MTKWNDKKDHLLKKLTKKTTYTVAAGPAGDTYHLPPPAEAARHAERNQSWPRTENGDGGPCRHQQWQHANVDRVAARLSLLAAQNYKTWTEHVPLRT